MTVKILQRRARKTHIQPLRAKLLQLCRLSISPLCAAVPLCRVKFQQHKDITVLIPVQILYVEKFAKRIRLHFLLAQIDKLLAELLWGWTGSTASVVQPKNKRKQEKLGYFKSSVQVTKCVMSYVNNFLFHYTNNHCAYCSSVVSTFYFVRHIPTALSDELKLTPPVM